MNDYIGHVLYINLTASLIINRDTPFITCTSLLIAFNLILRSVSLDEIEIAVGRYEIDAAISFDLHVAGIIAKLARIC